MNARHRDTSTETGTSLDAEGPLRRWARRRREVAREEEEALAEARRGAAREDGPEDRKEVPEPGADATEPAGVEDRVLTDEDMPSLESLDENSDYSSFLSPGVSERLRRRALRKLFASAVFNVPDGLDDYADDFTSFEALGDIVTSDMRHQAEVEEERARQAQAETEPASGSQEGSDRSESEPLAHADEAAASPTEPEAASGSQEGSGRSEGEPLAHADEEAASPTEPEAASGSQEGSGRSEGEPLAHADEEAASPTEPEAASGSQEGSGRSENEPLAHADEEAASPTQEAPPGEAGPADSAAFAGSQPPQVGMAEGSPQRTERADPAPTQPESGSEPMHAREPAGRIAGDHERNA